MQTQQKQFFTKKEAAEFTTLSLRSIDYLISVGKLKATKVGGRVIVDGKSLTTLITRGTPVYRDRSVRTTEGIHNE